MKTTTPVPPEERNGKLRYYYNVKERQVNNNVIKYNLQPLKQYFSCGTSHGETVIKIVVPANDFDTFMSQLIEIVQSKNQSTSITHL